MKIKNNYNECITNLACSIRKYFDLDYKHNTLSYIDKILEEKNPKNVIVILFDGMGSRIIDRTLGKDDFFIKNRYKEITTVFPATTTAATQTMRSGLNPCEHGWLGWNTYIKDLNKTITLFKETEKLTDTPIPEFTTIKEEMSEEFIVEKIQKENKYFATNIFPFGDDAYKTLDEMISKIETYAKLEGKKYIYAYDEQPDYDMHDFGPDSKEVHSLIKERNKKIEEMCNRLEDSLIIITADHGHKVMKPFILTDYPEIINMLERTISLEQRATSFKIKPEYLSIFPKKFNELFGEYFNLYTKEDIITSKLFGDGIPYSNFEDAIGDFISIAENSDKGFVMDQKEILYSNHAGYTDDEIYIPLIIIDKK